MVMATQVQATKPAATVVANGCCFIFVSLGMTAPLVNALTLDVVPATTQRSPGGSRVALAC